MDLSELVIPALQGAFRSVLPLSPAEGPFFRLVSSFIKNSFVV